MIVAVSSNPAIDRVAVVPDAAGGGVRRASAFFETAGGKAAHVAAIASQLGAQARLVVAADARYAALLADDGVDATVVPAPATRGTYTVVDERAGDLLEIHEPGGALAPDTVAALLAEATAAAADAAVVVSAGSLAPGLDPAFHARVASAAAGRAIVDTSDVEAMRQALGAAPFLVKPNLDEARAVVGDGHPATLVRRLLAAGARNVWLSLGADGSVLGTPGGMVRLGAPMPVRRANAVGAGDALLGGLTAGLAAGADLVSAARLGVAAATAKVAERHPARVDVTTVERLARSIHLEPLTESSPT